MVAVRVAADDLIEMRVRARVGHHVEQGIKGGMRYHRMDRSHSFILIHCDESSTVCPYEDFFIFSYGLLQSTMVLTPVGTVSLLGKLSLPPYNAWVHTPSS